LIVSKAKFFLQDLILSKHYCVSENLARLRMSENQTTETRPGAGSAGAEECRCGSLHYASDKAASIAIALRVMAGTRLGKPRE
jgi:hypothetical protein